MRQREKAEFLKLALNLKSTIVSFMNETTIRIFFDYFLYILLLKKMGRLF